MAPDSASPLQPLYYIISLCELSLLTQPVQQTQQGPGCKCVAGY